MDCRGLANGEMAYTLTCIAQKTTVGIQGLCVLPCVGGLKVRPYPIEQLVSIQPL